MGGDEVGNQKLLFAGFERVFFEQLLELVVAADAGFHHLGQRALLGVLGRNLEVAAHVVRHQFFDVLGAFDRQVVAHTRADEDFLDALERSGAAVHLDQRRVVGVEVRADARVNAGGLAAGRFNLSRLAADAVHVGGRAAQVGNRAGKTLDRVANRFDFADHRVFRAALDDAAFVLGDRAERAATKAAAHDVHAKADHLPGRDLGGVVVAAVLVGVAGVRGTGVRQVKHIVHLGRGQRDGWRVDPDVTRRGALAVRLHQRARVAGIGFQMQHAVGVSVEHGVAFDLLIGRQANHRAVTRRHLDLALHGRQAGVLHKGQRLDGRVGWCCRGLGLHLDRRRAGRFGLDGHFGGLVFAGASGALLFGLLGNHQVGVDMRLNAARRVHAGRVNFKPAGRRLVAAAAQKGGAANVGDVGHRLLGSQAVGDLDNRPLGVAVQQQVAFGIDHHTAADFV